MRLDTQQDLCHLARTMQTHAAAVIFRG